MSQIPIIQRWEGDVNRESDMNKGRVNTRPRPAEKEPDSDSNLKSGERYIRSAGKQRVNDSHSGMAEGRVYKPCRLLNHLPFAHRKENPKRCGSLLCTTKDG